MESESIATTVKSINPEKWLTGAVAGAISVLVAFGVRVVFGAPGAVTLVQVLGILLIPGAVFGLIYAGIASVSQVTSYAREPKTGVLLGLVYGLLFWVTTIIGSTITIHGLAGAITFGVGIGLLYALSPYT